MVSNELKTLYIYLLKYNWYVYNSDMDSLGFFHICLSKHKHESSIDKCVNLIPMELK